MANESYHHGDLKAELIRQGLKILDEEGYEGFSLRKVANACNVSQTAPYRHFKNKDGLILAIALQALSNFDRSLSGAVLQYPGDPESQLREMGCAYVEFFVKNPEYLRLIFLSDVLQKMYGGRTDPFGALKAENGEDGGASHPFQTFFKAVERYMDVIQGKSELKMEEMLLFCWGLVHGIALLIASGQFKSEGDALQMTRRVIWGTRFPC